ncbi:MAG: SH3 domain-containing protein [Deltaproteobacteria bacterium]|nr:SH3 domain-containing protein [Deltaproteobacteria bacterium]
MFVRRIQPLALVVLALLVVFAAPAAEAACKGAGPHAQIKAKTPIRRGPGLNYPVSSFLDEARCAKISEVSTDGAWALIEGGNVFGWIPSDRFDAAGQKLIAAMAPSAAPSPVGSGQERGSVVVKRATTLREGPSKKATKKKKLAPGARVLALAVSNDEKWIEVRDDRNDTGWISATRVEDPDGALALAPRSDGGLSTIVPAEAAPPAIAEPPVVERERERAAPRPAGTGLVNAPVVEPETDRNRPTTALATETGGLTLGARVLVGASMPNQSLDSNGASAFRRYDMSAVAAGGRVEVSATPIGPLELRLGYAFTLVSGLAPAGQSGAAIGGRYHEPRAALGVPLEAGATFRIVPELGYYGAFVDMDPAFVGAPTVQFVDMTTHAGSAGGRVALAVSESFALDGELAFLLGATAEGPIDLGQAGMTVGFLGGVGASWALAPSFDLLVRWDMRLRRTGFTGASKTDPTITQATLSAFDHALMAGAAIEL